MQHKLRYTDTICHIQNTIDFLTIMPIIPPSPPSSSKLFSSHGQCQPIISLAKPRIYSAAPFDTDLPALSIDQPSVPRLTTVLFFDHLIFICCRLSPTISCYLFSTPKQQSYHQTPYTNTYLLYYCILLHVLLKCGLAFVLQLFAFSIL